jgi:hypothetical protein
MARLTRLVCAADPGGSTEAIAAVVEAAERDDAQAIAVVGNLGAGSAAPQSQRAVFRAYAVVDLHNREARLAELQATR